VSVWRPTPGLRGPFVRETCCCQLLRYCCCCSSDAAVVETMDVTSVSRSSKVLIYSFYSMIASFCAHGSDTIDHRGCWISSQRVQHQTSDWRVFAFLCVQIDGSTWNAVHFFMKPGVCCHCLNGFQKYVRSIASARVDQRH
jgi:hypothetical protein